MQYWVINEAIQLNWFFTSLSLIFLSYRNIVQINNDLIGLSIIYRAIRGVGVPKIITPTELSGVLAHLKDQWTHSDIHWVYL